MRGIMTIRQAGETGIKLIGVYFAASGAIGITQLLASFAMPRLEGFLNPREMFVGNALPVAGALAVAAVCLFGADALAGVLFEDDDAEVGGLSHRDLLAVGLALLGVSIAVAGVPALLQAMAKALWYAEASRQSLLLPTMERSLDSIIDGALLVIIGGILALCSRRLASMLDSRASSDSDERPESTR